jgi:cation diffusion facilitator CzcD-associated flavoprotein CzcO
MYETAHFISSKTLGGFDEFPMPSHYPDYPAWHQILAYLRSFADAYGLHENFEGGANVTAVTPDEQGGWRVELASGVVRRYLGVVIAIGHDWIPRMPSYPGSFSGESYHSVHYRSPKEFMGKRVLVVGGGNSACDIASDAATFAERAFISVRRGYYILPKHIFGKPTDLFFRSGPQPNLKIAQPLLTLVLKLVVGDLTRYGLPAPDHKPLETHPIVNSQLLHHLSHGDITAKPDVAEFAGREVRFTDGSRAEVDVVVFATGYRHELPCLDGTLGSNGGPPRLWGQMFSPAHPNLFVAGFFESDSGAYPLHSRQAEIFATLASSKRAQERLAQRMRVPTPDLTGGIRHVNSPRHAIHVNAETYVKFMRRLLRDIRG